VDEIPVDVERLRLLCPQLGSAGLAQAEASERPPRGKILKLKLGFNPNSSSVGTTIVVLLWSAVASGAVMALAGAVLSYRFSKPEGPGGGNA
jgi:hypothetical protein